MLRCAEYCSHVIQQLTYRMFVEAAFFMEAVSAVALNHMFAGCRGCSAYDSLDGVLTPYVQACSTSNAKYVSPLDDAPAFLP